MSTGIVPRRLRSYPWPWLAALLLVALLGACGVHRTNAGPRPPAAEEDEVVAAALEAYAERWKERRLVVHAWTEPMLYPHEAVWRRIASIPGMAESTMADFEVRHGERRRIGPLPPTRVPVTLVEAGDLPDLPRDDRGWGPGMWQRFRAKFDDVGGIHALSRAGFSADRTQAVLIVRYNCGTRCGIAMAMLLIRDGEGWRVVEEVGLWFH